MTIRCFADRNDDFADVLDSLETLAASWDKLARKLKLNSDRIEIIDRNHRGDSETCLSEIVKQFLRRNYDTERYGRPSWRMVAQAVASVDMALAQKIANAHRGRVTARC